MTYTQVKMRRLTEYYGNDIRFDGCTSFGWVPTNFAVVGKILQFEKLEGTWYIAERYETRSEEEVISYERLHLKHRNGSDI